MIKWEYRMVTHRCERNDEVGAFAVNEIRVRELNGLGSEGWELVSVVPVNEEDVLWAVTYVLKRPRN
jgi:hypothetical protein